MKLDTVDHQIKVAYQLSTLIILEKKFDFFSKKHGFIHFYIVK